MLETRDLSAVAAVLPTVGALISTTVQEPWQTLPNVAALSEMCRDAGVTLLLDSTQTPLLPIAPPTHILHRHSRLLLGDERAAQAALLGPQAFSAAEQPRIATLPARWRIHSDHAQAAADVLSGHPQVRAVYFAGLSTHPQPEQAARLTAASAEGGLGGLLTLEARRSELRLRWDAEWGGPRSALMALGERRWQLWLGLEEIADLLDELETALQ